MALAVIVLFAASALAEQLGARDEPRVEGPFTIADSDCQKRVQAADEGGSPVASARACLRFYQFDPASETDATRDYGVVWIQSNVDATSGWCATRVASKIAIPSGTMVHGQAPGAEVSRIKKRRTETVTLAAAAGDTATTPGSIAQDFIRYPNRLKGAIVEEVFKIAWAGKTARKLGFAGGIEISWESAEGPPADIGFDLGYRFEKDC